MSRAMLWTVASSDLNEALLNISILASNNNAGPDGLTLWQARCLYFSRYGPMTAWELNISGDSE